MDQHKQLKQWVEESKSIVFFGGAGVSTESDIPDFRSKDGLYSLKYSRPPEVMLSYRFFLKHPEEFYPFYQDKILHLDAKPNKAHLALAALEKEGKLKAIITQNIDGLHQAAGSKEVLELHGSVYRNHCMECGKTYDVYTLKDAEGVATCSCGGMIRPDVVMYGEALDQNVLKKAADYIKAADMLIVGGTSLVVTPASGLVKHYQGDRLVLINKSSTPMDRYGNLLITDPIGETLGMFL